MHDHNNHTIWTVNESKYLGLNTFYTKKLSVEECGPTFAKHVLCSTNLGYCGLFNYIKPNMIQKELRIAHESNFNWKS